MPRRASTRLAALGAGLLLAIPLRAQRPTSTVPDAVSGPVAPAALDEGRTIDAELRLALHDLLDGRAASALARLAAIERSPTFATGVAGGVDAARRVRALRVLTAESYARLGMLAAFEGAATPLLNEPGAAPVAPALRARLAVAAYARGDDAAAIALARPAAGGAASGPLLALVTGLAHYRRGSVREARAAFAEVRRAGGAYAAEAAYADAVALARADTTNPRAALDSLVSLTARASGSVADQARVTAAQLAYQMERFDQAAALTASARAGGGLGAQALLTHAWALYKGGEASRAAVAFDDFARRYGERPARDEARIMAAQAILLLGRTTDAARRLRAVADSAESEARGLERSGWAGERAAALVAAHDAGALLSSSDGGRSLSLAGLPGFGVPTLVAAVNGDELPRAAAPELRLDRAAPASAPADRVRHAGGETSGTATRQALGAAAERLTGAEAASSAARLALEHALADGVGAASDAAALRRSVAQEMAALDAAVRTLDAAETLTRITRAPATGGAARRATGARGARGATAVASSADRVGTVDADAASAAVLQARRDSLRLRVTRVRAALTAARARAADADRALAAYAATSAESPVVRQARAAVAETERARAAAERDLVAAVERELDSRRSALVATLRRDAEAAEFAAAGAAFLAATRDDAVRPAQVVRPRRAAAATPVPRP